MTTYLKTLLAGYLKTLLAGYLLLWIPEVVAQQTLPCDSILHIAHKKLGSLYTNAADGEGYFVDITVSATYRDKAVGEVKPQQYRMASVGNTLLFESENADSYQSDSIRISVIKNQNRIYISNPKEGEAADSYMKQFNAIQDILPNFISIQQCEEVDGRIKLGGMVKTDTLGLGQVNSMRYIIDKKTNIIKQIVFEFTDSNPLSNYTVSYSDVTKPYQLPKEIVGKYIEIASRSTAGLKQFEQYLIIDNRKQITHD